MNHRVFVLSVAARLPHGMFSIAVLVHVAHVTGSYGMVDRIAPTGTRTEAFAWLATATAVGSAIGAALAGVLVDASGAGAGFLLAGTAATLAAALAGTRLRLNTPTAWLAQQNFYRGPATTHTTCLTPEETP